jgi:hypothetical protein
MIFVIDRARSFLQNFSSRAWVDPTVVPGDDVAPSILELVAEGPHYVTIHDLVKSGESAVTECVNVVRREECGIRKALTTVDRVVLLSASPWSEVGLGDLVSCQVRHQGFISDVRSRAIDSCALILVD